MLREILARPESGRVSLLWGSRHANEVFWQAELAALRAAHPRFSYQVYLSAPDERAMDSLPGRITQPLLTQAPTLRTPTFYLVGSGAMVREVKAGLVELGFDRKRQIRNEVFFA
jgi:ferredoxin-NADP reductase